MARVDLEKQNYAIEMSIRGKYDLIGGHVIKKNGFEHDKELDSMLKLPNLRTVLNSTFDSLFYLADTNIIVDTSCFFSSLCICKIGGKTVIVSNDFNSFFGKHNYNLIWLRPPFKYRRYSFEKKRFTDYWAISLRHRSSQNTKDNVTIFYRYSKKQPVIKELKVIRRSDF
jgi:hypothetical protein